MAHKLDCNDLTHYFLKSHHQLPQYYLDSCEKFFRCMECGGDLEQHVNGKISYIPIMPSSRDGTKLYVKDWK